MLQHTTNTRWLNGEKKSSLWQKATAFLTNVVLLVFSEFNEMHDVTNGSFQNNDF